MASGKVLVTGGAGFIGSNIVDALLKKGYAVAVVDNLATGSRKNVSSKAVFYEEDIASAGLRGIFRKEQPDFVIHTAAQINVRKSVKEPLLDAKSNILGSVNVLECCREFKVKKVVYSSSGGACYGEPEYLPCDEKHPVNPISHYGASKFAAEHYFFIYRLLYAIDYTILRYANVYGPRQDAKGEAGVISIFLQNIHDNKVMRINGDGKQTRDYVFVGDVVQANLLALAADTPSRIFNIGTGKETDVNTIFSLIKKAAGTALSATHGPKIPGEVSKIALDASRAAKELGWIPKTSLSEGINKTVTWFNAAHS